MSKPYIICHMMTSIDGRIDCAMTAQLAGVSEYYTTLKALDAPTTVSGRITAATEMPNDGTFEPEDPTPYGHEGFRKNAEAAAYEVIVDTRGTIAWKDNLSAEKPLLVVTSEAVSAEYLRYLDERAVSWIVVGSEHIDLTRAMEVLADEFGVTRVAVVGGPTINTGFLTAGLLDEVSILIGPGIDGRGGQKAVFDGRAAGAGVVPLRLTDVKTYDDGAIWLRYRL